MNPLLEVLLAIIKEVVRLSQLIYGDLLYVIFMIFSIVLALKIVDLLFLTRIKNNINYSSAQNIINKKDYTKNLIDYLKEDEYTKICKKTFGKIIGIAQFVDVFLIIYIVFNFNNTLFIVLFSLNFVSHILVRLCLNKNISNRIKRNLFEEDEVLARYFFENSIQKKKSGLSTIDSFEYFDFLNLFSNINYSNNDSVLQFKMSKLTLSRKLSRVIIRDILENKQLSENIITDIENDYIKYFN